MFLIKTKARTVVGREKKNLRSDPGSELVASSEREADNKCAKIYVWSIMVD